MIDGFEKFRMKDEGAGGNDWFMEVNYDDTPEVQDCQIVRVTFPDGKQAYLKREYLNAMLFAIGTREDQMKMIPQKITRSRHYETMVGVTAHKDIRKGEKIIFPLSLTLPSTEEIAISEIKKQKLTGSSLIT